MNRNTASMHSRRHSVNTSGIKLIIIFKSSTLGENSVQIKMGISMIITVDCIFIKGIQGIKLIQGIDKERQRNNSDSKKSVGSLLHKGKM